MLFTLLETVFLTPLSVASSLTLTRKIKSKKDITNFVEAYDHFIHVL